MRAIVRASLEKTKAAFDGPRIDIVSQRSRGIQRPTSIPYIWWDEVLHPVYGAWATRLLCTHCDTEAVLPPGEQLTDVSPKTSRWIRDHIKCKRIHRGRTRQAEGKDSLNRILGGPNPWTR